MIKKNLMLCFNVINAIISLNTFGQTWDVLTLKKWNGSNWTGGRNSAEI